MKKFIWPVCLCLSLALTACGDSGDVSGISGTYNAQYDENNPHEVVALIDASLTFDGAGGAVFEDSKLKLTGTYKQTSSGYEITFEEIEAAAALVIGAESLSNQTMTVAVEDDGTLTVHESCTHLSFDEAKFYQADGLAAPAASTNSESLVSAAATEQAPVREETPTTDEPSNAKGSYSTTFSEISPDETIMTISPNGKYVVCRNGTGLTVYEKTDNELSKTIMAAEGSENFNPFGRCSEYYGDFAWNSSSNKLLISDWRGGVLQMMPVDVYLLNISNGDLTNLTNNRSKTDEVRGIHYAACWYGDDIISAQFPARPSKSNVRSGIVRLDADSWDYEVLVSQDEIEAVTGGRTVTALASNADTIYFLADYADGTSYFCSFEDGVVDRLMKTADRFYPLSYYLRNSKNGRYILLNHKDIKLLYPSEDSQKMQNEEQPEIPHLITLFDNVNNEYIFPFAGIDAQDQRIYCASFTPDGNGIIALTGDAYEDYRSISDWENYEWSLYKIEITDTEHSAELLTEINGAMRFESFAISSDAQDTLFLASGNPVDTNFAVELTADNMH